VAALVDPLDTFDYRGTLDTIWEQQHENAAGDVVAWRPIWQAQRGGSNDDIEDFAAQLMALERLSGGLVNVNLNSQTVVLRQSPDQIVARIANAIAGMLNADGDSDASTAKP
jgi:hypothetical protein